MEIKFTYFLNFIQKRVNILDVWKDWKTFVAVYNHYLKMSIAFVSV